MTQETDRELLELAAKAAGLTPASDSDQEFVDDGQGGVTGPFEWKDADGVLLYHWRPLDDDGDALRLAVKLRLVVHVWDDGEAASAGKTLPDGDDPAPNSNAWHSAYVHAYGDSLEAATRRAIVRAAAAIGRAMP